MYRSMYCADLMNQRPSIAPILAANDGFVANDTLLAELHQLRNELREYRSEQRHFFLAVRELIFTVKQIIAGSLDDKPLGAKEARQEASISRTRFYNIQNRKHTSYDESFPPFFRILGMKRWWRSQIRAWVRSHDSTSAVSD